MCNFGGVIIWRNEKYVKKRPMPKKFFKKWNLVVSKPENHNLKCKTTITNKSEVNGK